MLRPFSRLAVAHPDPLYARSQDGSRRTPVAPFYNNFDATTARWRDFTSGVPITLRFRRGRTLTEADLAATARRDQILCDTVGSTLQRNHRRPETKALDHNGDPCDANTRGLLQPAPTEALRLIPIGKETRNLERAGITEDPAHTIYTDPDDDAWATTILPALRLLAPGAIPRGRPSRHQRKQLFRHAGELARAALKSLGMTVPADPEHACHRYVQAIRQMECACGCGQSVHGRARYLNGAHRTRAYRARTPNSKVADARL